MGNKGAVGDGLLFAVSMTATVDWQALVNITRGATTQDIIEDLEISSFYGAVLTIRNFHTRFSLCCSKNQHALWFNLNWPDERLAIEQIGVTRFQLDFLRQFLVIKHEQ